MESKLDVLTKKLYEEGVDKAKQEAAEIIARAKQEAAEIIAAAEGQAKELQEKTSDEMEHLKKKSESEMALSARQAVTALKQSITNLISGEVAEEIAHTGFADKTFVQELLMAIVRKWDVASGSLNLEIILSEKEKEDFMAYVASRYKDLLDKGLEIKTGASSEAFIIQPKGGGYQIAFSEELFEAFFGQYMRSFTKELLYK